MRLAAEHRSDASRLSAAVYRAYYTTSAVQSVIRDLAESGPREPSPDFDDSMLEQVRAHRRGQRRI